MNLTFGRGHHGIRSLRCFRLVQDPMQLRKEQFLRQLQQRRSLSSSQQQVLQKQHRTLLSASHRAYNHSTKRRLTSQNRSVHKEVEKVEAKVDAMQEVNVERARNHMKTLVEDQPALDAFCSELNLAQHQSLSRLVSTSDVTVKEPSWRELQQVALNTAIPFIGFGIMDNGILIVAGDAIDQSLGVTMGISTMCAAAIGNIISDVAGVALGTVVEDFCARYLSLPVPALTTAQRRLRSVRFANQFGCGLGLVIGCTIGMIPLLFLDSQYVNVLKREKALDNLFQDVVSEARGFIGAQKTNLYIVCHKPKEANDHGSTSKFFSFGKKRDAPILPASDGDYLYAKYSQLVGSKGKKQMDEKWIPLGRGIISRAALTGEAWNIENVNQEPDYLGVDKSTDFEPRTMLVVPVLDGRGNTIGVLQAINKMDNHSAAFTESDINTLQALASHIGVSLQRMYFEASTEGAEEEEHSLKNTIKILKDSGFMSSGPGNFGGAVESFSWLNNPMLPRTALFPED